MKTIKNIKSNALEGFHISIEIHRLFFHSKDTNEREIPRRKIIMKIVEHNMVILQIFIDVLKDIINCLEKAMKISH